MELPHFNPYGRAIKKYLVQVIENRYTEDVDNMVDRIAMHIANKREAESISNLFNAVYEAGFNNAMDAAQEAMKKHGMKFKLRSSTPRQN